MLNEKIFGDSSPSLDQSLKLAQLWLSLKKLHEEIHNTTLPLAAYLQADDEELWQTLELAASSIQQHFDRYGLKAHLLKKPQS